MATVPADVDEREQRLHSALAYCLEAMEDGQPVPHQEVSARFPEFAAEIAEFLAGSAALDRWTSPFRALAVETPRAVFDPTVGGLTPSTPPPQAQNFGDYEILEEIGRGGMGVVYKARQKSLNRLVALKMIRSGRLASKADMRRFRNEAEAVAQLDHPNIVPVYEVGEIEGQLYFSMKLVEGGSIAEFVANCTPAENTRDPRAR